MKPVDVSCSVGFQYEGNSGFDPYFLSETLALSILLNDVNLFL